MKTVEGQNILKGITIVLALALGVGCVDEGGSAKNNNAFALDPQEKSVESAIAAFRGILEGSDEYDFDDAFSKTTDTGVCNEAAALQACENGTKSVAYESCALPFSNTKLSGEVLLEYSDINCSMAEGNEVRRSLDLKYVSGRYQLSVLTLADGGRLAATAEGWEVSTDGHQRVVHTPTGRKVMDMTITIPTPITITGTLRPIDRIVDGGSIEIEHTLAGFQSVYTPTKLRWESNCCYPVSGELGVEYFGNITGSGSIQFNSCGSATIQTENETRDIQLLSCE